MSKSASQRWGEENGEEEFGLSWLPIAELPEEDELVSGLVLGLVDEPDEADPGLLLVVSGIEEDPLDEEDELGGVVLLPVPALPAFGLWSPHAASAAATAATAHSFANVREVFSMCCTPKKDNGKADPSRVPARPDPTGKAIDMPEHRAL